MTPADADHPLSVDELDRLTRAAREAEAESPALDDPHQLGAAFRAVREEIRAHNESDAIAHRRMALLEAVSQDNARGRHPRVLAGLGRSARHVGRKAFAKGTLHLGKGTLHPSIQLAWWGIGLVVVLLGGGLSRFSWQPRVPNHHAEVAHVYTTATGQTVAITLADGSRIRLAPQAVLRVPKGFGSTSRDIVLTGEASFDIAQAVGIPFRVCTGSSITQVLGTHFNIRQDHRTDAVYVTVTAGKVTVRGSSVTSQFVTLAKGMTAIVRDSAVVSTSPGQPSQYTEWDTGQIIFTEAPTADVLTALTRWYGYQFRVTDSTLLRRNLTLGLSIESSATALATLKQVLEVDLAVHGTVITLSPHGGMRDGPPARQDSQHQLSTLHFGVGK